MRLNLLKEILAVPTCSGREDQMVRFLVKHLGQHRVALRGTRIAEDCNNSVFIRKGGAHFLPCVAAHLDTVHPLRPVKVVEQDGVLFGLDEHGQRAGIGADDKAGVFVCLELLERFVDIAVALFGSVEIGCRGAYDAPAAWFRDVGCVVEFDCPGHGQISYTCGGTQLFADDGDFIRRAGPVLVRHGLIRWQRHTATDVTALRRRFGFSCLNLPCGYHDAHGPREHVVLDHLEAALAAGDDIVRALGCRRYPFGVVEDRLNLQPLEVTSLQWA